MSAAKKSSFTVINYNEQKAVEICRYNYKRNNPKISNINIARHFEKKFDLDLNDIKLT